MILYNVSVTISEPLYADTHVVSLWILAVIMNDSVANNNWDSVISWYSMWWDKAYYTLFDQWELNKVLCFFGSDTNSGIFHHTIKSMPYINTDTEWSWQGVSWNQIWDYALYMCCFKKEYSGHVRRCQLYHCPVQLQCYQFDYGSFFAWLAWCHLGALYQVRSTHCMFNPYYV